MLVWKRLDQGPGSTAKNLIQGSRGLGFRVKLDFWKDPLKLAMSSKICFTSELSGAAGRGPMGTQKGTTTYTTYQFCTLARCCKATAPRMKMKPWT